MFFGFVGLVWSYLPVGALSAQPLVMGEPPVLHSLPGLLVLGGDLPIELEQPGFTKEALLSEVDSVLNDRGMTVLDEIAWVETEGSPVFYLDVTAVPNKKGKFEYSIRVEIQEFVESSDPSTYRILWSAGDQGQVDRRDPAPLRAAIHRITHGFMDAYLKVN